MVLPVAIGGILLDIPSGIILGLAFGLTSFMKAPSEALGQIIISYSGIFAFIVCVVPRVCVGLFAGIMGSFIRKREKKSPILYLVCGAGSSLINTVFFMGLIYIFCQGLIEGAFGIAIWSSVAVGGVVELVCNGFLTFAIAKALKNQIR